jgi:type IV secretion system protein TrbL
MLRLALALLLLASAPAFALGTLDPAIASDGLLTLIKTSANTWSSTLRGLATDIFWILALIQFVWTFGKLGLRQPDFSELLAELVRFAMITGFYMALLLYSVTWAQAIVDSFRSAAAQAAGVSTSLQPGDMFGIAVELGRTIGGIGLVDPVTAFVVSLSAILVVLCFTFIAAFMMVTLIESYIVINAGVFFMAFGGSEWTREYALTMLRYSVAVGAKLFVLTLIVGLIMISAREWQAAYNQDETSMLTMVGLSLVCAYLAKTLPDMIQSLINGVSGGGGSQIGGMIAGGLAGVAAGAMGMSAARDALSSMTGGGQGKSASDLLKSSFTGAPSGSGGSGGGASGSNFMGSGGSGGGSYGGGSSSGGKGPSPRIGGGGQGQSPGTPPSPQPSGSSAGAQSASSTATNVGSSAATGGGNAPTNAAPTARTIAHGAADAAVRGVSSMASIAVPGMEGVAGTSIGPAPTPPDLSDAAGETPSNIIRPESAAPMGEPGSEFVEPSINTAAQEPVIDTMSNLQNILNNHQGKP